MSTATRPTQASQGPGLPGAEPTRSERRREADAAHNSGTERTLRAAAAAALGVLPLASLFSDIRWFADVLAAIAIVGGTAAALRYWHRPHVWHTWVGLILLVPWLTWRFVPTHAIGHVLPTGTTFTDLSDLMTHVRDTMSNGVAPVPSDHAITLVLAAVAGLLAAFIDFVAVVGRRPALAGVPLLVVFTVAGAVRRHPVSWVWFAATAVGFLLLLSIDARDEVRDWGRVIPRAGESRPTAALAVSGPRIAFLALLVAVVLPLAVPARTSNLLANAFHNGGSGSGGPGTIGAGGVALNPFAALKGELVQSKPTPLFSVTVQGSAVAPYYLRANVLANYTDAGWSAAGHHGQNLATTDFQPSPQAPQLRTTTFLARISISGLSDNPPVFANPIAVGGVDTKATGWDAGDQLLIGSHVKKHQAIDENVQQPNPTVADLEAAPTAFPPEISGPYLRGTFGAAGIPLQVTALVDKLTKGKNTEYAKARAILDYFTVPANGFTYSLQTASGDSGSALVDFLDTKIGFCQQFAAAMGIMLRLADVPSRVVLGYTHAPLDASGTFTVTTSNAHAWVEAYFPGIGWVPFDPTPITPSAGAATADVPWAPHPGAGDTNPRDTNPAPSASSSAGGKPQVPDGAGGPTATASGSHGQAWGLLASVITLLVVASAASTPAVARRIRRRRRLRAAGSGNPDPIWAELSDTAIDLGYVWSPARTPRQVVGWLAGDVGPIAARSLRDLAAAVEQTRYGPPASATDRARTALVSDLKDVESQLRARRSRSTRVRSWLLPASLEWLPRRRNRPRRR
ncbi:MAG TPA: DUF3488 and transglutaminase-like domain-containing protein [Jatrophihabitantaceae bacterium]|nr:DUF3488 and transglutaminase-like domain-containing protein [Jatrophihabitantaceae bacterium]